MNTQTIPLPWSGHLKATLVLGLPLIGSHLARMSIGMTDTLMLGWYGVDALAASVLATSVFFVVANIPMGFGLAVMPMVATAQGEGDERQVRRIVRMGLWVTGLSVAVFMPVLWYFKAIMLALGQQPVIAELSQDYMRIAMWGMFPNMLIVVLNSYLAALERAQIVFWTTIAGTALNAMLNYAFIFGNWGVPELGIKGAAIASVVSTSAMLLITVVYSQMPPELRKYAIFVRIWRSDWPAFLEVFRIGWPIGMAMLAETGMFVMSAIMMGWIGTVELATHGIVIQIASMAFMIYLGLSNVATVRAGRAFGRKDPEAILRGAWVVIGVQLLTACVMISVMMLFPEAMIGVFLDLSDPKAPAIVAYGVILLSVAAAFQIVDGLQVIGVGLLRGIKDTQMPMILASLSYWAIGLPVAYLLGIPLGYGGIGIWAGLVIGLSVAAVVMLWRFFWLMRDIDARV